VEKLKMHSPDLTAQNIDRIAELFPTVVTETVDADGNVSRAVDFDLLRQELSDHVVEGPQERYQLDWPGKREAFFTANAPIAKTLRPVREESVDFDTTQNLFIEGDNLEALKLMQESYFGKVKLIYIDPPYNTGNDFVYNDDFAETNAEYLAKSGQVDDEGNRLVANTESNGRFHSDWLSMMYPRLKLARNLLAADGLILISIDDNEASNLRIVADEVFGRANWIATLAWKRRQTTDSRNYSRVSQDHEYVVCFARSDAGRFIGTPIDESKYRNPDNDPRGPWASVDLSGLASASQRPNLHYDLTDPVSGNVFKPNPNRGWSKSPATVKTMIAEGRILFPSKPSGRPREKKFLSSLRSEVTGFSTWLDSAVVGFNTSGTREVSDIFGGKIFDFPKPVSLLSTLYSQVLAPSDTVLDFFAGSASAADAVLRLNASDGGSRGFIVVTLPEPTGSRSEAAKAGYATIADLSKERIRRVGKQILEGEVHKDWQRDVGFRVLKIDTSNMTDVLRTPDQVDQAQMFDFTDSVKADRTGEDLIFQVLLDWGLELTMPIQVEEMAGQQVFVVEGDALIACFAEEVSAKVVSAIAERKPLRAVFRDSGFASDADRINAEQVFAERSPATDVKTV
jgi:adenine-specific DNA-methyltransferase